MSQDELLTLQDFTDANVTRTERQIVLNVGLKPTASARWVKFTAEHVGTMVNDRVVKVGKILDPNMGKGFW